MIYAGADWIEKTLDRDMSPLGRRVADIIGYVTRGIYHADDEVRKMDWSNEHWIEWRTRKMLSTFDLSTLTGLVVLAHDQLIRVEIRPCSNRTVAVVFHPRKRRTGGAVWDLHPSLEKAVRTVRAAHSAPTTETMTNHEGANGS